MVRKIPYTVKLIETVVAMLICIAATCLFSACEKDHHKKSLVVDESLADSRTVLVYMVAENSLNKFVAEDVNELIQGVKNAHLKKGDKVVIYLDDSGLPRVFVLDAYSEVETFLDLVPDYSFEREVNSASAEQLTNVLEYTKSNYPASSYGIVFWSHGSGWIPPTSTFDSKVANRHYFSTNASNRRKSFGVDNGGNSSSNKGAEMTISEMADALQGTGGVDYILFDACFMQSIEVDYALRNCTKYIIGSPAEIPGPGANYTKLLSSLFKAENYAQEIVDAYFEEYENNEDYGAIISAVETYGLDRFASYMRTVVENNRDGLLSFDCDSTLNYFNYKQYSNYAFPDYFDMKGVMSKALSAEDYQQWQDEFSKIVLLNRFTSWWFSGYPVFHGSVHKVILEQCGGVSMFVPLEERYNATNYVKWHKDTKWGQIVWGE